MFLLKSNEGVKEIEIGLVSVGMGERRGCLSSNERALVVSQNHTIWILIWYMFARSHSFSSVKLVVFLHLPSHQWSPHLFVWYTHKGDKNTLHLDTRIHKASFEKTHFIFVDLEIMIECECTFGSLIFIWFSRRRRRRRRRKLTCNGKCCSASDMRHTVWYFIWSPSPPPRSGSRTLFHVDLNLSDLRW